MKMTKLLAMGSAAAVAVASLASVASAAEKTFDMGYASATYNADAKIATNLNTNGIGASADQATNQLLELKVGETWSDTYGWESVRNWETNYAPKLVVTGYKTDKDGKSAAVKKTFTMNYKNGIASIYVLKDSVFAYKDGEFAPAYFDVIENMTLTFPVFGSTVAEGIYNNWSDEGLPMYEYYPIGDAEVFNVDANGVKNGTSTTYEANLAANDQLLQAQVDAENAAEGTGNIAASVLAYALTHGGAEAATGKYTGALIGPRGGSIGTAYDVLKYTEKDDATSKIDAKLDREEVLLLSKTGDHSSTSNNGKDGNQTYNDGDMTKGTAPQGFAGFASQVANFFNKQTNGTITFTFEEPTASTSSSWFIGGIPSTEVGLKDVLDGATLQDFALFFNYGTTGGTMLSAVKLDAASGTVTFDISEYLDSCGGLTSATLNNIYYGLTKDASIVYEAGNDNKIGLMVKTVTLAYDEDNAADIDDTDDTDDTADDTDDTIDDTDDTIDDTTDDTIDDTTDDTTDDTDDTTDDTNDDDAKIDGDTDNAADDNNAAGDTVIVKPSDDSNPDTGVALAVVPAAIAAAAVVVSKKRK